MTAKPRATSGTMRARVYPVLQRCIERGASRAWLSRIWKHDPSPTDDAAIETIVDCVTDEIAEAFDFPEDDEVLE